MPGDKTDLLQGTLDLIVLRLLRAGPANGWDLTQSIQVVSKGALDVNYGSLYPALAPPRSEGLDQGALGHVGEQSSRALLRAHCRRDTSSSTPSDKRGTRFSHALGLILRTE